LTRISGLVLEGTHPAFVLGFIAVKE